MSPKGRLSTGEIEQAVREGIQRSLIESAGWQIQRHRDAVNAFDELVEKHCDSAFLASRLAILKDAHRSDTWDGLTGFADPDSLRTVLKRLRVCAHDVERLRGGVIGKALLQNLPEHALPTNLRGLADRVEKAVKLIKPRTNLTQRAARADIVRHVRSRTGGPCDRLVAAILYPTLGCDERAQGQWRHDNRGIIRAVRPT